MVVILNLKGLELLAFALVYGFTQDGQSWFSGSIKYVEKWLNCSRPTAISTLEKLTASKLLIKQDAQKQGIESNRYRANLAHIEVVKKSYYSSKETLPPVVKKFNQSSKEILPDIYNNTIEDKIESAPAQFHVTSIALETIPTVEENVAPGATEPDWMDVARQMEAHAKGEGAAQWRFMCEAQGYRGDIMPIVSNWAGKASKYQLMNWKSEFRKLQTWLKTESRADFKAQQRPGTPQPATSAGFSLNQYKPKQ